MELRRAIYLAVSLVSALAMAQGTPPAPAKGGTPGSAAPPGGAAPAAAAAPAAPAAAAAAPVGVKADSPCKQDVEAFCSDIQPGGGRLSKCLQEHESQLSNNCRTRIRS